MGGSGSGIGSGSGDDSDFEGCKQQPAATVRQSARRRWRSLRREATSEPRVDGFAARNLTRTATENNIICFNCVLPKPTSKAFLERLCPDFERSRMLSDPEVASIPADMEEMRGLRRKTCLHGTPSTTADTNGADHGMIACLWQPCHEWHASTATRPSTPPPVPLRLATWSKEEMPEPDGRGLQVTFLVKSQLVRFQGELAIRKQLLSKQRLQTCLQNPRPWT